MDEEEWIKILVRKSRKNEKQLKGNEKFRNPRLFSPTLTMTSILHRHKYESRKINWLYEATTMALLRGATHILG